MAIIGIDFGTVNSGAFIEYGKQNDQLSFRPVKSSQENEKHLPSYVQYDIAGDVRAVGNTAKLAAPENKKNTVFNVKRLLGRRFDDENIVRFRGILQEAGAYELTRDDENQVMVRIGSRSMYPEEIAAEIIAVVIKDALDQFGDLVISQVVVSVPANYDILPREKTKISTVMAIEKLKAKGYGPRITLPDYRDTRVEEIKEIQLVSEPTAALITYLAMGDGVYDRHKHILIFDLGAGTLDITIGKAEIITNPFTLEDQPSINVVHTYGDNFLGGRDMDGRLADWVDRQIEQMGEPLIDEIRYFVRENIERTKIRLSSREKVQFVLTDADLTVPIRQTDLEEGIADILTRIRGVIRKTIDDARLSRENIGAVILVGGPTNMPCVRRLVAEETIPFIQPRDWDSMLCVAEGAARYGAPQGTAVVEPTAFTYYAAVEMFEDVFVPVQIIEANRDKLPTIKDIEMRVPKPDKGTQDVRIRLVSSRPEGDHVFNEFKITSTSAGITERRSYRYHWQCFDADQDGEICSGPIRFKVEITKDGLLTRPNLIDPTTKLEIPYPDLKQQDLGTITPTSQERYEADWTRHAKHRLERVDNDVLEEIGRLRAQYPTLTKEQAVEVLFKGLENAGAFRDEPFQDLRNRAYQAVNSAKQSGVNAQLTNQWTSIIDRCSADNEDNRQALQNVIHASSAALINQ